MSVDRITASKNAAAHSRAARLVDDQAKLVRRIDAFFNEVAEVRELLEGEGSLWIGPVLDPPLEAAFRVWQDSPENAERLTLAMVAPAPLMSLELER
jgi:hypothetical protein